MQNDGSNIIYFIRVEIEKYLTSSKILQIISLITIIMQLIVIFYHFAYFFHNINPKSHDWVQNLCLNQFFWLHQSYIKKSASIYLFFLSIKDNRQSDIPLAFCQCIVFMFYIVFIMFLVLLAYKGVFAYIFDSRHPLIVKII